MKGIQLEILSHTLESYEQEKQLEKLDIEVTPSEEDGEWVEYTFYNISSISKALYYPKRSLVASDGTTYVCKLSYEELKDFLATQP